MIAGGVSEQRDIVSKFSLAEKQSFLCWGQLASGHLPLVHTHGQTDNCNFRLHLKVTAGYHSPYDCT